MSAVPTEAQKLRYAAAVDALNRGEWSKAQELAMPLIREVPAHAGLYFVAGVAALQLRQIPLALECLDRAVRLNPGRADYLAQLARALSQARMPRQAMEVADRALAINASDAAILDLLGVVYTRANAYAKAADIFRQAVATEPSRASYRFNYATSCIAAGALQDAERELEACLALDPNFWKAYLALSQLQRQSGERNHVDHLRKRLEETREDREAELYLNLALAKEYEDLDQYGPALDHLIAGKSAGGAGRGHSAADDRALFDAIKAGFPALGGSAGRPGAEPIFVFGMPRSGTTLVDRILSSHRDVQSAGELQAFGVELKRLSNSASRHLLDADVIGRARDLDWKALGSRYIDATRSVTGQKPRFVDKLPHNFLYAGYIAAALPEAKMICLRRNPMDTCLGNFRQLFALTSPYYDYSFDLMRTGEYYLQFDSLMKFWHEKLPGRIMEVEYESLVLDQEGVSRRLLEFCGLDWDPACLRFEENQAPVATASAVQVRSGMNRDSLLRWKRYGDKLDPLRRLLEEGGIEIRG